MTNTEYLTERLRQLDATKQQAVSERSELYRQLERIQDEIYTCDQAILNCAIEIGEVQEGLRFLAEE